jgi:integrase/recombinase XerD
MSNIVQKSKIDLMVFLENFNTNNTKKAYKKDLIDFFKFTQSSFGLSLETVKEIDTIHFVAYRDYLKNKSLTTATVNRKFSSIKSFWKWMLNSSTLDKDPTKSVKLPRVVVEQQTEALKDSDVVRIYNVFDDDDLKSLSRNLILHLVFDLGLRRSEVVSLKVKNIKSEKDVSFLEVLGKGGKFRRLPLNARLTKMLDEYFIKYRLYTDTELLAEDYLVQSNFCIKNIRPASTNIIYRCVQLAARKANLDKRITPHSGRATLITKVLESGTPITEVADIAGHSSINTTQIYWKKRKELKESKLLEVNYGDSDEV